MSMASKAVEDEPSHLDVTTFGQEVTPTIAFFEAVTPLAEEVRRGVPTPSPFRGLPDFFALTRIMEGNSLFLHHLHISFVRSIIYWA